MLLKEKASAIIMLFFEQSTKKIRIAQVLQLNIRSKRRLFK